jgi:hypothetical protein
MLREKIKKKQFKKNIKRKTNSDLENEDQN